MRIIALLFLIACSSSSPKPPPPTPPTSPSSTGPLSEDQFKALHELPAPEPAARRGQRIDLADGSKAYLSLPSGKGPFPAIVVIHEWWGLGGHIEHWTDRLATAGWAALAVDLYGGVVAKDRDTAMAA